MAAERQLRQDLAEYLARAEAIRLTQASLDRMQVAHGQHAEAIRERLKGRGPVISNGRVWRLMPNGGIQGDTYTMDSEIDRAAPVVETNGSTPVPEVHHSRRSGEPCPDCQSTRTIATATHSRCLSCSNAWDPDAPAMDEPPPNLTEVPA